MKVQDLMVSDAGFCRQTSSLHEAAKVMWERGCGIVPVLGESVRDEVIGVVTDRDLAMAAYASGRTLQEIPVARAMATRVYSCKPTDSLKAAEKMMRRAHVRRLPVVDDANHLLGVISLTDIAAPGSMQGSASRDEPVPVARARAGDQSRETSPVSSMA